MVPTKEPTDHQVHVSFVSEHDDGAEWIVTRFALDERFNAPYTVDLDIRSLNFEGDLSRMLGARAEVTIERAGLVRTLHGILDQVDGGPLLPHAATARVQVSPALVALRHRRTSRVFTDLSVVGVLREVIEPTLAAFGRKLDVGWLGERYPERAYITQYQETDLDFVSRLMEDEGIAYRFAQGEDAETLILLDDDSGYAKLVTTSGPLGLLPMVTADGGSDQREDLRSFVRKVKLGPNRARAASFDWRSPGDERRIGGDGDGLGLNPSGPELEHYDYEAAPLGAGPELIERKLNLKRRRLDQAAQRFIARTTATGITVGSTFEVVDHPSLELNGEYLVTAVVHRMAIDDRLVDAPLAGGSEAPPVCSFSNECECQPIGDPFVPAKTTKRPFIAGVVAGTVASDWADEQGRLQVGLLWDRHDSKTCAIPVVQPWAGAGWGTQFFPRAGMRVYVAFTNGDPDHPVVLGATYNEPPYTSASRQSGIKTAGASDSGKYNELMFDDTDGAEMIRIRGERDIYTHALRAHHVDVGTDQTTRVHGIQDTTVDGDRVGTYQANRRVTVANENRLTVRGDDYRTVQGATYETHTRLLMRTVLEGDVADSVLDGNATYSVAKSLVTIVGENMNTSCTIDRLDETGGNHRMIVAGELNIDAMRGMKIFAPAGIKMLGPTSQDDVIGSQSRVVGELTEVAQRQIKFALLKMKMTAVDIRNTGTNIGATGFKLTNDTVDLATVNLGIKSEVTSLRETKGLSLSRAILQVIL